MHHQEPRPLEGRVRDDKAFHTVGSSFGDTGINQSLLPTGLLLIIAFSIDIMTPLGIAIGVLYIFPLLATLPLKKLRITLLTALVSTILICVGYLISPESEGILWKVIANRVISSLAVWVAYLIVRKNILSKTSLDALHQSQRHVETVTEQLRARERAAINILKDIEQANQALIESEHRTRLAILEAVPTGMAMIDQQGKIAYHNTLFCQQFGYAAQDLLHHSISLLIPERFRQNLQDQLARLFIAPESLRLGTDRELYGLPQDGKEFPIEMGLNVLTTRENTFVLTAVVDLTERQRIQEESQEKFKNLIHSNLLLMWTCTADGQCDFLNEQWLSFTGKTEAEQLGYGWHEQVHPDDRESLQQAWEHSVITKTTFKTKFRIRRHDGQFRWFQTLANPLHDEQGQVSKWVGCNIDIHEQQADAVALQQRTSMLALNAEIGDIVIQSQDIQPLLQGCAETLVSHQNMALARIWTLDKKEQVLELQASAGLYTHLNGPHSRVPVGQFKIGKIASEKRPHLTNAVIGDPRVPEQEWAQREGLVAFAGYPLMSGQHVLGVMGMFARHPLEEHILSNLQAVATRITAAIELHDTAKEHLQLSELNNQILTSAKDGIWGLDLKGTTTFVNPAAARMLGYAPEELLGTLMHQQVHHTKPDGSPYPREDCPMYAAYIQGATQTIAHEVLWRKDGTSFPVEYTSTPTRDEHDQVNGAVVTFRNITERLEHQRKIHTLSERLQLATQAGQIGVWDWDVLNQVLTWDTQMYQLYGMLPNSDPNTYATWTAALHPEDQDRVQHALHEALADGAPFNTHFRIRWPNQSIHHIRAFALVVQNDQGHAVRMTGVNWDITTEKVAENALTHKIDELHRSNAELEQFAYVASHDLQEPLRKIRNYSELLEVRTKDQLPPEALKYLAPIVEGATRMQTLVQDLLSYSRVARGELTVEAIELQDIVREVQATLEPLITKTHATLTIGPLPTLKANRLQMEQLLQNLIANGLKYHGTSPPIIEISATATNDQWTFAVRDNGIGIDPQYAERIFVIFQRLHTKKEYSGTGIGLAICRKIVELHGGEIWVESTLGQGSTFFFTLPSNEYQSQAPELEPSSS